MANTDISGGAGRRVDVGAVIDSAKFFPVPFGIAVMMIIIMLTDGFDLFTMGYVGPHLIEDWGVTRPQLGPVNTAGLIGMAIGSVGMGWLGDRLGRKKAYVACLALLFIGSLLCFFAADVTQLTWFRGLTGLGLGGVTPLAATLISEWTNKKVRSIAVACVVVSVPLGGTVAGYVERWLVPDQGWHAAFGMGPGEGWRAMFLVGAIVPLVLFALFSFVLPESPKFMAQRPALHGRLANALNRLLGEKRFTGGEQFYIQETPKEAHASNAAAVKASAPVGGAFIVLAVVLAGLTYYFGLGGLGLTFMVIATIASALAAIYWLFKPRFGQAAVTIENSWFAAIWRREYAMATALIWAAFAVNSFVLYLFTNYLPTLLTSAGVAGDVASQGLSNFSLGAFFGSIGGAILIGWFGSRWVGTALAFLGVVATGVIAMTLANNGSSGMLLAICLVAGASINGMQAFMYAVAANAYPTEVRGSAVGMAQTFSRLGAVISPIVASAYFAMQPVPPVSVFLWFIAGSALVTTISFFLIPSHIAASRKRKPSAADAIAEPREAMAGQKPGGGV